MGFSNGLMFEKGFIRVQLKAVTFVTRIYKMRKGMASATELLYGIIGKDNSMGMLGHRRQDINQ